MAMTQEASTREHETHMTGEAWAAFIAAELKSTCKAYLEKPAFLLGHSRTEKQTAADYAGRELLELVQNAADAASEVGGSGRVLIEVTEDALYVANTGQPFRKGGVASLMTAHTSDKPTRAARMIGAKGLGFRAILNWTEAPIISSGALELGFSRAHARTLVASLATQNAEIAANFSRENLNLPPLLVFPATGTELDSLDELRTQAVLRYARKLREDGYDTVIAAPLDNAKVIKRAKEQATQFQSSFLLFVRALDEIRIRLPDCEEKKWSKDVKDNGDVSLLLETGSAASTQDWIVRQKVGAIGQGENGREFELAIAIRSGEKNSPGKLHSFFPTSLPLPFAGLFHATLELNSSRKTINENSQHNLEVLQALGRLHAEMLSELRKSGRITEPLDWLIAHQEFPDALKPVAEAAWLRASDLPIVRCMDRAWRKPGNARIGPAKYAEYLPARLFSQLASVSSVNAETLLRDELRVPMVNTKDIVDILRGAELSFSERAKAIVGIAKAFPEDQHDRRLLIDIKGKEMSSTATAFPPPSDEAKRHGLPEWANARFIHPELWSGLLAEASGNVVRDKIHSLKGYRVVEYSAEAVIAALRSRATDLLKKKRSNPDQLQASLLATVYALHDRSRNTPQGVFRVRCKDGEWRDISTVHLSEHYGNVGRITAALYPGQPELLIGTPRENGFGKEPADLVDFLIWLGINPWPRKTSESLPVKWRQLVIDAVPENFQVTDGNTTRELRRSDLSWGYTVNATYDTVSGLGRILSDASTDAILAWLALDPRLDPLTPIPAFNVRLEARENGMSKFRAYQGSLPNTVQLDIQTCAWLDCQDGLRYAPRDAMIEPGVLSALFQVPRTPLATSELEFGLDKAHWRRGLERAGVVRNLDDLPELQVYRLLSSLPSRQIKPEAGSRLLLQILEQETFDPELGGADGATFRAEGQLPIQLAGRRVWAEREGVYYAQRDDFPSVAKSHLRLLDLPSRRNAKQVMARFGVPTLQKDALNLRVCSVDEVVEGDSITLRSRFDLSKPYITALRKALSPDGTHLRRLEALQLKVVSRAEMELLINGDKIVEELDPWRHSLNGDTLIITVDATRSFEEMMDLGCHAVADGLAELFELQSGGDFVPFMASSTDVLRRAHLQRALPSFSEEELASLIGGVDHTFVSPFAPDVDSETLANGPAAAANKSPGGQASASSDSGHKGSVPGTNLVGAGAGRSEVELTVQQRQPHNNTSAQRASFPRRTLRVAGPTGHVPSQNGADPSRAADAEHWTAAFERANGRWPQLVAHLQGTRAFGCDYLSFEREEDRVAFLEDPRRIDLVIRFIETKSGSVKFSDNEWLAANSLTERYFIYRISFTEGGRDQAQLTVVSNPSARIEAIRTERELLVDKVNGREEFDLVAAEPVTEEQPLAHSASEKQT